MAGKRKASSKKPMRRADKPRRGRGEAFTQAKETAVEVRTGFAQTELKLPPVEDYQHHRKTIFGYLDQLKSAQGRYRKALKTAQAAGIDTDAMLEAKRIKDANDPKGTAHRLNQLAFALEQEGVPIHITITDTLAGDHAEQVAHRYFEHGKAGRGFECDYPESSDLYATAKEAWVKGQGEMLGVSQEQIDAANQDEQQEAAE